MDKFDRTSLDFPKSVPVVLIEPDADDALISAQAVLAHFDHITLLTVSEANSRAGQRSDKLMEYYPNLKEVKFLGAPHLDFEFRAKPHEIRKQPHPRKWMFDKYVGSWAMSKFLDIASRVAEACSPSPDHPLIIAPAGLLHPNHLLTSMAVSAYAYAGGAHVPVVWYREFPYANRKYGQHIWDRLTQDLHDEMQVQHSQWKGARVRTPNVPVPKSKILKDVYPTEAFLSNAMYNGPIDDYEEAYTWTTQTQSFLDNRCE